VSQSFQFLITNEDAGRRLDGFLASRFGGLSRMRITNLIAQGGAFVNRAPAQSGYRVEAGDLVEIAIEDQGPTAMDPEPIPLEIVYEDSHLIVVVKPEGMLVHPTRSVKGGTLANALAYHLNKQFYDNENPGTRIKPPAHGEAHYLTRPGIVHRLDRATSGLMVVAKTARALSVLSRHFHKRLVEKRYLALAAGAVAEASGAIIAPIGRDPDERPHWRVMESGKPAETRFRVVERFPAVTLIELEPVTGRTNQLRIHCAHAGHAILGDERAFAGPSSNLLLPLPQPPARLCLHAWRLAFHHPATGDWLTFKAPLPSDISAYLDLLRGRYDFSSRRQ